TAIEQVFFSGRFADRPVYLDLDERSTSELSEILGIPESELVGQLNSVVAEKIVPANRRPFGWYARGLRDWIADDRLGTPPFLALLCSLTTVAAAMGKSNQFGAGNYYGRFGETHGVPKHLSANVQRAFRRTTPRLWEELNNWLASYDGARGLPTAMAYDHRRYIGLPLSQVMLSESNRGRLEHLFGSFGLTAGQYVAPEDLARLVDEWLSSGHGSVHLRNLWKKRSNRARISDVVSTELSNWDGVDRAHGGSDRAVSPTVPLLLLAWLRLSRRPTMYLTLGIPASSGAPTGLYKVEETVDISQYVSDEMAIDFRRDDDEGYLLPIDNGAIRYGDALFAMLELEHPDGAKAKRLPSRVVVLADDAGTGRFEERVRLELGRPSALLVHESVLSQTVEVLETSARPGYREYTSGKLNGVPEGWCLITDVQLIAVPDTAEMSLQPLIPISWTSVDLSGGLSLPGAATWHSDAPPDVMAVSAEFERFRVTVERTGSDDAEAVYDKRAETAEVLRIPSSLGDGDYAVKLFLRGRDPVVTRSLRLRSGALRRPHLSEPEPIGYSSEASLWPLAASTARHPEVWGNQIGELPDSPAPATPKKAVAADLADAGEDRDDRDLGIFARPSTDPPLCLIDGGGHYWLLPTKEKGNPRDLDGVCKLCGGHHWFPARPKPIDSVDTLPTYRAVLPDIGKAKRETRLKGSLLFDSLLYLHSGSWTGFRRLVSQFESAPWASSQLAQHLSHLGHIEVDIDPNSLSPRRWMIAPAVHVVNTATGTSYLSGDVTSPTLAARAQPRSSASLVPPRMDVPLDGVDTIEPSFDAHVRLARGLPHLSETIGQLPMTGIPIADCERFEHRTGRWVATDGPDRAGAYRLTAWPRVYGVWDGISDRLRVTTSVLAKWYSADGQPMIR
ncbi:MAG: hypothetical protein U9R51_05825, partial [Actinomycetota bacterium]|nr:hypothetical protein [Actinomycetota bacterium]